MRDVRSLVGLEIFLSAVLLGAAFLWDAWRGTDLWEAFSWRWPALLAGLAVALCLFSLLPLVTQPTLSRWPLVRDLRRVWDLLAEAVGPRLATCDIILLATCSGFSEEVFFRGVLQREIGLVGASAIFGLLHLVNLAYAVWAGVVGAVFGVVFQKSATLVAPVAAHAAYNFLALSYLRHQAKARAARLP